MQKYRLFSAAREYNVGAETLRQYLLEAEFSIDPYSNCILTADMVNYLELHLSDEKKRKALSDDILLTPLKEIDKFFKNVFRKSNDIVDFAQSEDYGSPQDEYCPGCQETPCQCSDPQWKGYF